MLCGKEGSGPVVTSFRGADTAVSRRAAEPGGDGSLRLLAGAGRPPMLPPERPAAAGEVPQALRGGPRGGGAWQGWTTNPRLSRRVAVRKATNRVLLFRDRRDLEGLSSDGGRLLRCLWKQLWPLDVCCVPFLLPRMPWGQRSCMDLLKLGCSGSRYWVN